MMTEQLTQEIRTYIFENRFSDLGKLSLSKFPFDEENKHFVFQQIASRQKAAKKLPTYVNNPLVVFPSAVSVEQTSSEATASFKAGLVSGESLLDITGGLGIDSLYFSKHVKQVTHCELSEALSIFAAHNFKVLGANNISCQHVNGLAHLFNNDKQYDWIYIDPARRDTANQKVFNLSDCEPDVTLFQDDIFSRARNVLVKTSPMLDIAAGLRDFKNVAEIYIVAVKNEVKELLWILKSVAPDSPQIFAVNLSADGICLEKVETNTDFVRLAESLNGYLYEPNAALMKSGAVNYLSKKYEVAKLAEFSHLFVSEELRDFPGRRFKIKEVFPYQKKYYPHWQSKKMNISTRNFFETPEVLRKKFKIKDGGDIYTFFTTSLVHGKVVILCEKV